MRKEGRILAVRDRNQINEFASGLAAHEISNEFSKFSEATRLFGKYFYVKSHMLDCVGDFIDRNFDRFGQLGMHYRGTDHHSEYEFIDQHMMVDAATEHFPQYESIFVATDEKTILRSCALAHDQQEGCHLHAGTRQTALGYDQGDNYHKGFHALDRLSAPLTLPSSGQDALRIVNLEQCSDRT